jgi:hypothetical protein
LNGSQQLQLFNSCLPENLQKEMQLFEREKSRNLAFVEFYAYLEAKFGRAQSESMRKRWLEVQMPKCLGRYTVQAFDEFRVDFKLAFADVPDGNKEEARRVLMEKLLPWMRKWVVEAEGKKMREKPVCDLLLPSSTSLASVCKSAQEWSGSAPTRVEDRGEGRFLVMFGEE